MELDRIKRNVTKMVGMNAPESDIDAYISSEGATVDQVKTYRLAPASQETQDPRITKLQEPGAAQRILRAVPFLGGALDEIGAGADAALDYVSGGRIGEPYEQGLARRRDAIAKSDAEHPIRNTVDAVLGGVATANALPFFRPIAGNGMMATAANAGINAAGAAAATGFTEGEGGLANRLENAKEFGKTGLVAGTVLGAGGQMLANRLAPTAANSVARQADNIGIQVPQFMEGGRASQQVASKIGAVPFMGDDVNAAVMRTRDQAQQAAENISNTVAPNILAREAGETASGAMQTWADAGARTVQDRAYGAVDRAMQGVTAPLMATSRAAQQLVAEGFEAASPLHTQAVQAVEEAINRPNGLAFEGLSRLRSHVGRLIDNDIDPNNRVARAGLQRIYGALTDDMQTAIATNGGRAGQNAWERANAIARQVAERRDVVAKIVGAQGDKAGEGIVDKLVTLASTKSSADAARLQQARRVMGAEAWRGIAGNAIVRLGRNQSNEFSADIFLKNYRQLSHEGRQLLFNSTGDANLQPQLDALAAVSQRLQQFSRLGNPSGTGGVAALLAALSGAASGDMGATLATAIGGRGIGMLMSRPAVIRNATAHALNMERLLRGRTTQAALAVTAANLARIVAQETGQDAREIKARIDAVTPTGQGASRPQRQLAPSAQQ